MGKATDKTTHNPDGNITFIDRVRKADTTVVVNDLLSVEDSFIGLYMGSDGKTSSTIMEPPYNPATLMALALRNNILAQCIQAMEVSIDGTGYTIDLIDAMGAEDEVEKTMLEEFFKEPFPEESFITIRREMRVDLESCGNAYMEVIRNLNNEVMLLRYLPAVSMRLMKLDKAVQIEKTLMRGKKSIPTKIWVRERRFVQKFGTQLIYFKEFGASRELDRDTGNWGGEGKKLDVTKLASEIIHFTCQSEARSPYGVPRWINQLPSVIGSRKAEEFNLDFFDAGGLPPAVVFIQGGAIVASVKEQLLGYMSGKAGTQHRAAVVEVQSTSGSLDSSGSVQVKVERFGGDRTNDAMFQKYDVACSEHVRSAFRLPPLFLGMASDYNFATALTGYMVAEAQVFQPERLEFDSIINIKICKSLGAEKYRFHSVPISLRNADLQLKAIELVKDKVDGQEYVESINEITGLTLEYSAAAEKAATDLATMKLKQPQVDANGNPLAKPDKNAPVPADAKVVDIKTRAAKVVSKYEYAMSDIVDLADAWCVATGLADGELDAETAITVVKRAEELTGNDKTVFNSVLSAKMFSNVSVDRSGLAEIAGCCAEHMHP